MAIEITPEIVDTLAAAANLTVRLLEDLDVQNVEPIVSFDPRWR